MSRPDTDVVVVGAGIVGLAAAAALARRGRSVLILERARGIAQETTSRNSQVVHAGLYYPPGSLKAVLCTAGREALYERCKSLRIPHRKLGKLVVATNDAEGVRLERLLENGRQNGVPGLEIVDGEEAARREPEVRAVAALVSPESGIVDAHALALSYQAEAEAHGANLLLRTEVEALEHVRGAWRVEARGPDGERERVTCAAVVNAAGLWADRVAELAGIDVDARGLRQRFCKGDTFALAPGRTLELSHLVYPLPSGGGLGIHATLDLDGRIHFGPDAEYVAEPSYQVDPDKADRFAESVSRYLPALRADWLVPEMAGLRPRLHGPGEEPRDFAIEEESQAGLPGLVNCIGIESPGLTAAPAIAERIAHRLDAL